MIKIVNRGYIYIKPLPPFFEWANQHDEDFENLTDNEGSIYLIEDDFYDDEPVIKANFKKIFENELFAITDNEELFPEITFEQFEQWFSYELGTMVLDTQKTDLLRD